MTRRRPHSLTCWLEHDDCALARARDLELMRRETHAGRARAFGEALARVLRHVPPEDLGSVVAEARKLLDEQYAEVEIERLRLRHRFPGSYPGGSR